MLAVMSRALAMLAALWAFPLLVLLWLKGQEPLMIQRLTVDVAALAGMPPYAGLISNLGVALWLVTGWVLLFTSSLTTSNRRQWLWPGLLSLLLGMDDGLMLHEEVLPKLLHLDDRVVQPALYIVYLALLSLGLRRLKRTPDLVILGAALGCLAASMALDLAKESDLLGPRHILHTDAAFAMWLEDGFKWLGIVAWAGYWQTQAWWQLRARADLRRDCS